MLLHLNQLLFLLHISQTRIVCSHEDFAIIAKFPEVWESFLIATSIELPESSIMVSSIEVLASFPEMLSTIESKQYFAGPKLQH